MTIPIVMVAFGTTSRARTTYRFIDRAVRQHFPQNEIHWAYSSRMVTARAKHRQNEKVENPHQVMAKLAREGHDWAVVQSLHLICGHEFYRLVDEVSDGPVRVSMGLPLLTEFQDYTDMAHVLSATHPIADDEALVMVGHGTDHPIWTAYIALHDVCRATYGSRVFCGVVEGHPSMEDIVGKVAAAGYRRVRLVPFMLVAGVHFHEDLAGGEDSWRAAFEARGIAVDLESRGLGHVDGTIDIFVRHIREGLAAVPVSRGNGVAEVALSAMRAR